MTDNTNDSGISPEENLEKPVDKENQPNNQPVDNDYATELAKVKDRPTRSELDKALYTGKHLINRIKELGGNPQELIGEKDASLLDDEEKPVTKKELENILSQNTNQIRYELGKNEFERELSALSKDKNEQELAKYHYQNTIRLTGDVKEDVASALALANRHRLDKQLQEIRRANESKANENFGAGNSGQAQNNLNDQELTVGEKTRLATFSKYGLTKEKILAERKK